MVEGDEKSKHISSLGGWVQAAQQAEELGSVCLRGPSSPFKKRLMLLDSEDSGGDKPLELPLIVCLNDLISVVFYLTSLS
jgi:hypothetical protein